MRGYLRGGILACCLLLMAGQTLAQELVRIGIQAYRPKPQVLAQWAPLAAALDKAIPGYHFVIEAHTVDEFNDVVAARQVDFVLTNPSQFILMDHRSGLSAALVSLSNLENGKPVTSFGGVIFSRADRDDIQRLEDLKGKTAATISLDSFGGYQMQAYELLQAGLRLPDDVRPVITKPPQDKVVEAVLSGRADIGFVRTGLLEDLATKGKLDLAKLKVIHQRDLPGYPHLLSTTLYPEWVLAAMPQTDNDLKRRLASFLLNIQDDKKLVQSLGIYGFDVPTDYIAVENMLRELRLPPL